ncbi:MAG: type IV pilus secretin PilQ [Nitrospiraceae bacterium]|nr:type IV pilus secretin PilQ [Nitrospiraceae bacterium]
MRNFVLFTVCCLLFTYGTADAKEVKDSGANQITDIEVLDNTVKIKISGPIKYKVSSPADPFRATVAIEGVGLGKFRDKIYSHQAGITEIILKQIETPVITSYLDILLQSPSSIKPEIKGDTLILHIESQAGTVKQDITDKGLPDKKMPDAESEAAKEINAAVFDKTDEGIELVIKGDGVMPEPAVFELDGKIIIDIPDVVMKASLPSSIPSPVKDLKYKAEKGNIRFILDIEGKADTEVVAMEDEIIVDIAFKDRKIDSAKRDDIQKAPNSKLQTQNSKLVSLDFQDADIVPILRLLGDVSGYNIVIHPDVKGKITMKLMNVPWEQALDMILKTFTLEKVVEGNVIRIATLKAFQEEKKAVADTKEVFGKAEDIETKIFTLGYADADKIRESIDKAKLLTPRGSISIDARTRSLIIKDIPSSLDQIQRLVKTLDKQTPQVLIEARIVEMNSNFTKDIGVQWGGQWQPEMGDRNTTLRGGLGTTITGGQGTGVGLVNLPISGALTQTSAVTIGYLNAAQTFGLDLRLLAAETVGKANIISSPKVMTVENEKAEITHGTQIPVVTPGTANTPPTVTYKDANLKLVVTPSITPDDSIFLNIEVTNDVPDFTKAIQGNVPIDKREAKNKVLVKNGETVVIGGILRTRKDEGEDRVPGLHKIPILGWLFKRELKKTESQELLIFITPRIVKQQ